MKKAVVLIVFLLTAALSSPAPAAHQGRPLTPAPKDRCPVCGMFVAKHITFSAVTPEIVRALE